MKREWLYRLLFGETPETHEKLIVEIEADTTNIEVALERVERRVESLHESLKKLDDIDRKILSNHA